MLAGAERPVVIAGQGVLLAEAWELRAFAELTGIPVATSPNGKGSIDETHELALGPSGATAPCANGANSKADVIGARLQLSTTAPPAPGYRVTRSAFRPAG
jgi:thiamine pyrophosphate-dependent acetolactate synthase large subunit-like protein